MVTVSRVAALVLLAGLAAGCTASGRGCLLDSQRRMTQVDLYFGRDIAGRGPVTDGEWSGFAAQEVAPRFPAGFTVLDANGQWLSPASGAVAREASKVVRIVTPEDAGLAARVRAVAEAYKARFRQEAVGVVSSESCAAF